MQARKILNELPLVDGGPFFPLSTDMTWLRAVLPTHYLDVASIFGGKEGFVGKQYLRIYRHTELHSLNQEYEIGLRHPGLVMVASDGYGDGFGFLNQAPQLLRFALIPLPTPDELEAFDVAGECFDDFVSHIAADPTTLKANPTTVGLETHLKQPLCFGGDFRDSNNIVMVTPSQHAELARYWNPLYRKILAQQEGKAQQNI